ncbi:hypothetical protein [Erysipelatoclostridium ramosum]|uniref:Zn-finger containing protein n=1 Tax=Thomasclavelia ramosa TaxID=1547 RepID=A0A6N3CHV5_9FIRM
MKEKFYRFMQGRYGIDQLNSFLMIVCVICFIVNMFIGSIVLTFIAYGTWLFVIFRMFSKNIYARNRENDKYLNFFSPLSRWLKLKLMSKQDPSNKFFSCPKCKQMVRVPKGHGTVVVTCPNCQNKFEKRT